VGHRESVSVTRIRSRYFVLKVAKLMGAAGNPVAFDAESIVLEDFKNEYLLWRTQYRVVEYAT
jgi:hypothetical protein